MFKDIIELLLIICFFIILPIIAIIYETRDWINYKNYYTYVDLDNNEGRAYECTYTDKTYWSGGMGTPICKLKDGTIIVVKQYKFIREKREKGE